jgi:hypothetical protein
MHAACPRRRRAKQVRAIDWGRAIHSTLKERRDDVQFGPRTAALSDIALLYRRCFIRQARLRGAFGDSQCDFARGRL